MHGVFGHVFRRAASRRREDFPPRPVCISLAASPQLCPLSSPPPFRQIHFSLSRVHAVILPRFRHYASLCIYFYVILIPALRCSVYSRPDYFATACIPSQRLACAEMLSQLPLSLQGTLSVVLLTLLFLSYLVSPECPAESTPPRRDQPPSPQPNVTTASQGIPVTQVR